MGAALLPATRGPFPTPCPVPDHSHEPGEVLEEARGHVWVVVGLWLSGVPYTHASVYVAISNLLRILAEVFLSDSLVVRLFPILCPKEASAVSLALLGSGYLLLGFRLAKCSSTSAL